MKRPGASVSGVFLAIALIPLPLLPSLPTYVDGGPAAAATLPVSHDASRPVAWDCTCYQRGTPITFVTELQPATGTYIQQTLDQLRQQYGLSLRLAMSAQRLIVDVPAERRSDVSADPRVKYLQEIVRDDYQVIF